jgi:hypothetical protein
VKQHATYPRLRSREKLGKVLAVCSQNSLVAFPDASVALDTEVNVADLTALPHPNR